MIALLQIHWPHTAVVAGVLAVLIGCGVLAGLAHQARATRRHTSEAPPDAGLELVTDTSDQTVLLAQIKGRHRRSSPRASAATAADGPRHPAGARPRAAVGRAPALPPAPHPQPVRIAGTYRSRSVHRV